MNLFLITKNKHPCLEKDLLTKEVTHQIKKTKDLDEKTNLVKWRVF